MVEPLAKGDRTIIALVKPAPGTWTITPLPGSEAMTKVSYAEQLPPAKVTAAVSGTGAQRTLNYHLRLRPGQTVHFVEEGPGGTTCLAMRAPPAGASASPRRPLPPAGAGSSPSCRSPDSRSKLSWPAVTPPPQSWRRARLIRYKSTRPAVPS